MTGVRQDAYARAHPMQVEEAKTGREKGKYLNPTEWGKPRSSGIDYERAQQQTPAHSAPVILTPPVAPRMPRLLPVPAVLSMPAPPSAASNRASAANSKS